MDNKIFIYIGVILLFVYVIIPYITLPAPLCKVITDQNYSNKTPYTTEEELKIISSVLVLLHVRGESMLPTIKNNSKCLCVKKGNYNIGDIIFFVVDIEGEKEKISHRIFSIEDEKVFTKGDNNDWVDPPITEKNIVCAIPEFPRYMTWINKLV